MKSIEINSISISDAVFLESFSNVKSELKKTELTQINSIFKKQSILDLIDAFHVEYLQNGFTKEFTLFLSNLIPLKNKNSIKKILSVIISIIFFYFTFIKPFIKESESSNNNPENVIDNNK